MQANRLALVAWSATLALAATGCSLSKDKPVKVSGTVTLDGKPVAGAAVQFMRDGGSGPPAHGQSKEDGSFVLTTYNDGDGALPGDYKVLVTWEEPPPPTFRTSDEKGPSREEVQRALDAHRAKLKKLNPVSIPPVYNDPNKTPLRQTVPSPGKVEISLDSKVK